MRYGIYPIEMCLVLTAVDIMSNKQMARKIEYITQDLKKFSLSRLSSRSFDRISHAYQS